jgi:Reverse transcriptase (RNA-dependent DNA polymerase)
VNHLLTKAVPLDSPPLPNSNIREWSFRDIMHMPRAQQEEWKTACHEELESLRRRNVFELVNSPKGRKIIKNRWVFDLKGDGQKKAHLVAKGFSQVEGIDFNEIFSPVVRFETVWLMLTLAALEHWHITGVDVKTAFLYGELDEELYMKQPEGFKTKGQEHKVLCLKRAILLRFSGLNTLGGLPGPAAVTPAVAALVRAHFRQSHQIHQTGGPHRY